MSTYRLVVAIELDTTSEAHASECQEALWDGLQLGSNWEDLNPRIVVDDVEHTS